MRRLRHHPGPLGIVPALVALVVFLMTACTADGSPSTGVETPIEGDGWRQLGRFRTGVPYTVGLAQNPSELLAELEWHGIAEEPPSWDPATEVVAFFSEGIGSTCPDVVIDDITFDRDAGLVYGRFVYGMSPAGNTPRVCTADLVGSQTFVVALSRDRLPASPFTLRLEEDLIGCHPDCGRGPTEISVTLE